MNPEIKTIGRSYRFKRPVVLVLGAGSSVELGYPTSRQLSVEIIECLGKFLGVSQFQHVTTPRGYDSLINEIKAHCGFSDEALKDFLERFAASSEVTADYFVRRNEHFRDLVTYLVTYHLVLRENRYALLSDKFPWQQNFLGRFFTNPKDFQLNQLKVLTFNYDIGDVPNSIGFRKFVSVG